MDDREEALRAIVRTKLAYGRLPVDGISRFWVGPSNGETCDVCELTITNERVVEGIVSTGDRRQPLQLHVRCFYLWDDERQALR